MAQPSRRQHARFPCDLPVTVVAPATQTKVCEARLIDVGIGGAAIETPVALQRGVPYEIFLPWGGQKLRFPARVAWEGKPDAKTPKFPRYGLSFTLTVRLEDALKAIVDKVRQDLWSGEEPPPLRDYWSV